LPTVAAVTEPNDLLDLLPVLVAVTGTLIGARGRRRRQRAADARCDADRVLDALAALRRALRQRHALPEVEVDDLVDALRAAAQRVSPAIASGAQAYVAASLLAGPEAETRAYDELVAALVSARTGRRRRRVARGGAR